MPYGTTLDKLCKCGKIKTDEIFLKLGKTKEDDMADVERLDAEYREGRIWRIKMLVGGKAGFFCADLRWRQTEGGLYPNPFLIERAQCLAKKEFEDARAREEEARIGMEHAARERRDDLLKD